MLYHPPMDAFTIEISAHRIGGSDLYAREFGTWCMNVVPGSEQWENLPATGRGEWLRVSLARWVPVRPGLVSATARVADTRGDEIGRPRAVLVSTLPCDVPIYSAFIGQPDYGVISLGIRPARSAWMPSDSEAEAEAVA